MSHTNIPFEEVNEGKSQRRPSIIRLGSSN